MRRACATCLKECRCRASRRVPGLLVRLLPASCDLLDSAPGSAHPNMCSAIGGRGGGYGAPCEPPCHCSCPSLSSEGRAPLAGACGAAPRRPRPWEPERPPHGSAPSSPLGSRRSTLACHALRAPLLIALRRVPSCSNPSPRVLPSDHVICPNLRFEVPMERSMLFLSATAPRADWQRSRRRRGASRFLRTFPQPIFPGFCSTHSRWGGAGRCGAVHCLAGQSCPYARGTRRPSCHHWIPMH